MKKNLMLAVVITILVVFAGPVLADDIPRIIELQNLQGATVAGTAFADSTVQNLTRANAPEGIFGLSVHAESPTGDADIRIEFLIKNPASGGWVNVFYHYNEETDTLTTFTGTVIDSTLARFSREGDFFFFPVGIPLVGEFIVRVTGVNANPADTVVTAVLVRK